MSYTNPPKKESKKRREPTRHALWDRSREQAQIILNEMTATYERQVNFILARCNDLCQLYKTEARETIEKFGRQFEADIEEIWAAAKADVTAAQETMARWQVEFEQNTETIRLEAQAEIKKAQAEAKQVMAEALKIRAAAEARQGEVSRWMKQAELLAAENTALIDELNEALGRLLLSQAKPEPAPEPPPPPPVKKDTKKAGGKNKPLTHQKPKKRPNQRRQNSDD